MASRLLVSHRLPPDLIRELVSAAEEEDVDRTALVERFVREGLRRRAEGRLAREGLAVGWVVVVSTVVMLAVWVL